MHSSPSLCQFIANPNGQNQIYLDLRRQGRKIYYYTTQNGYEIDFVTIDKTGEKELIQVSWSMDDPKTAEREERGLVQAVQELGFGGRIITLAEYLRSGLSSISLNRSDMI